MKTLLCLAFIATAFLCHAQKISKNEVSMGYFTAGYFFDSTDVKLSKFNKGKNISLCYSRYLNKHLFLNTTYVRATYRYIPIPVSDHLPDNIVTLRYLKVLSANIGYKVSKWGISAKVKAGIDYRFTFEKWVHFIYYDGGNWPEPRDGFYDSKSFGATLGLTLAHPIVWKIFGELDCTVAQMLTGYPVDRQQLLLSYRIGIRF